MSANSIKFKLFTDDASSIGEGTGANTISHIAGGAEKFKMVFECTWQC